MPCSEGESHVFVAPAGGQRVKAVCRNCGQQRELLNVYPADLNPTTLTRKQKEAKKG